MANLFVLNVAGMVAPLAADKNANRLIGLAVQRLAGDAAPAAVEVPDGDALRAALFTRVAAGEVAAADAAVPSTLSSAAGSGQRKASTNLSRCGRSLRSHHCQDSGVRCLTGMARVRGIPAAGALFAAMPCIFF